MIKRCAFIASPLYLTLISAAAAWRALSAAIFSVTILFIANLEVLIRSDGAQFRTANFPLQKHDQLEPRKSRPLRPTRKLKPKQISRRRGSYGKSRRWVVRRV